MSVSGKALCRGQGSVRLSEARGKSLPAAAAKGSAKRRHDVDQEAWEGVDRALFDALRDMRSAIAKADGVPPYVVFHDAALRELARHCPERLEDLCTVKGIGERKSERYGQVVIQTITAYLAQQSRG